MIIAFYSEALRTVCEDDEVALATLDAEVVEALRGRLADVRAAETFEDVLIGNPRADGEQEEFMFVDLAGTSTLRFRANHAAPAVTASNVTDWTRVSRVMLVSIEERA